MQAPERTTVARAPIPTGPARAPRTARPTTAVAVVLLLLGALVGGGATSLWQRTEMSDTERSLDQALAERDRARSALGATEGRMEGLRAQLAADAERIAGLERAVDRTQARFDALAGPPLAEGRHFGYLIAAEATQEPPRLVLDLAEWFTDDEAITAALEDGLPREAAGENGYYIRNDSPRWRTLWVDPATTVTLATYPRIDPEQPTPYPFERFAELYASLDGPDRLLRLSPYWITVEGSRVVAIDEQFLP